MSNKIFNEKNILGILPTIYLSAFFFIPFILMILVSFRVPGDYGGLAPLFINNHLNLSLDAIRFVFSNSILLKLLFTTLLYSTTTTIICIILGYPVALLIALSSSKLRNILLFLVIIPFWSNFLIRIYAWMIILGPTSSINLLASHIVFFINHPSTIINYLTISNKELWLVSQGYRPMELMFSQFAVILCLSYVNLPFMILPLYSNLEKIDVGLLEASRDLGASKWITFWRITFPLSIPGIVAGSILVFIPCSGMFVVPDLVGNAKSMMIGNFIKQQFLDVLDWPLGSFSSIIMGLAVLSFCGIIILLINKIFKGVYYGSK